MSAANPRRQLRQSRSSEQPGETITEPTAWRPQIQAESAAHHRREADLVDEIRSALTERGIAHWSGRIFVRGGSRRRFMPSLGTGTPDLIGVINGRMFALEAKRDESSHERESQSVWMAHAREHGVTCGTVRTLDEALAIVARVGSGVG